MPTFQGVYVKPSLIITLCYLLLSCASVSMLPEDVSEIDFDSPEGKTGWSEYQQVEIFRDYSLDQIYEAAKIGLGSAGFSLRIADKSKGIAVGEHGMTLHDWNVIAGVYFKQFDNEIKVKVIVEGSKDIGISGDVTSDGWAGQIIIAMHDYLE